MKKIQKMFYYSSDKMKNAIEPLLKEKARITGTTESKIIEDYVIGGLIRDFPEDENAVELLQMMKQQYRFIDKKFLD